VDTPSQRELIAANNNIKEIERFVEADSLAYLHLDRLREAVKDRDHHFCYACYTGHYPTLVQIDELVLAKTGCC
jgi:amidophosphoribosyltransferase